MNETELLMTINEAELLTNLGARIRAIRSSKHMTQNDLAVECEFEKASMSRIESGKSNPTVRTLLKICRVLDVKIEDLFAEEALVS